MFKSVNSIAGNYVNDATTIGTCQIPQPMCKPLMNGAKCANCENYDGAFKESFYVPLHPRTNEDDHRKQICLRVNVCPINDLRLRKVDLN